MAYTDVISLSEAKNYLRIDDDFTEDDNAITLMINAALSNVEQETNYIMFPRDANFLFLECKARVYDFPINTSTLAEGVTSELKPTYTIYNTSNSNDVEITLNVGYSDPSDVPEELKQYALYLIDRYYYAKEGKESDSDNTPFWIKSTMLKYKRFLM